MATCMEHLLFALISVIFSPPLPTSLVRGRGRVRVRVRVRRHTTSGAGGKEWVVE